MPLTLIASESVPDIAKAACTRLAPLSSRTLVATTETASTARHLLIWLCHGRRSCETSLMLSELTSRRRAWMTISMRYTRIQCRKQTLRGHRSTGSAVLREVCSTGIGIARSLSLSR